MTIFFLPLTGLKAPKRNIDVDGGFLRAAITDKQGSLHNRNLCLTVLEVKSSESRCQQNAFLLRAVNKSLFQAVSSDFLAIMLCSSLYTVFPLCMSVFTFPLLC